MLEDSATFKVSAVCVGGGGMERGWLEYKMKAGLNEFSEVRNQLSKGSKCGNN